MKVSQRVRFITSATALWLTIQSAGFTTPVHAQLPVENVSPLQAVEKIDNLTKQILLKEIEIERFNLHYTLTVAKQGRWKGWRYATFQEMNGSLNLTGGIISIWNRGGNLHHSQGVRLHPQEAANYIPLIGNVVGAGAAAGEFGINTCHDLIARARGFSPGAAVKRVAKLKDEVKDLMTQRDELIKIEESDPSLSNHVLVDRTEGRILKNMLEQTLSEFARYHVGARKLIAFQQMQYLFDVGKYTNNALGFHYAFKSLNEGNRIGNGRAGIFFVVAGQLTIWAPVLSRLFARGAGALTRRSTRAIIDDAEKADIAKLQNDLDALDELIRAGVASDAALATLTDRQALFEAHERAFSQQIRAQEKKDAQAKLTATQNIAAGAFVGGDKTACGVLFLIPGFNDNYRSKTERAGRVTNDLLFTSAVVGLPATAFSMLDTLRIQIRGELERRKAQRAGKLASQIALTRLRELDDMERRLKAM